METLQPLLLLSMCSHATTGLIYPQLDQAMVIDTHSHTQNCCMLESCYIQHQQVPLDSDRFTLFALYVALLDWPCYLLGCFYYIIDMSVVLNIPFSSIYHKVSLFNHTYIIFFSVFSFFFLCTCAFSSHPVHMYVTWPHHRLTTLLYLYMSACQCQLFNDEGSRWLPKHLNYFHVSVFWLVLPWIEWEISLHLSTEALLQSVWSCALLSSMAAGNMLQFMGQDWTSWAQTQQNGWMKGAQPQVCA